MESLMDILEKFSMKNCRITLKDELYFQRPKTMQEYLEDKTWFNQIKTDLLMRKFWGELVL